MGKGIKINGALQALSGKLHTWQVANYLGGKLPELRLEVVGRNMGFMLLSLAIQFLAYRLTDTSQMCLSQPDINVTQPGIPSASPWWISEGKPGVGAAAAVPESAKPTGISKTLFSELIPTQAVRRHPGKRTQGRAGAGSSSRSRFGSRPAKHHARPTEGTLR